MRFPGSLRKFSLINFKFEMKSKGLQGDLVGVPHTCYLSDQSFITRLKLVGRELDMVAMNN